jgi:hypothetical protein
MDQRPKEAYPVTLPGSSNEHIRAGESQQLILVDLSVRSFATINFIQTKFKRLPTTMLSRLSLIAILTTLTSASPLIKRAPAFKLHPAGDQTLCLGVPTGTTPGDGTPLYNIPCASAATGFEIAKGDNQVVRLTGTNFCLDAGSSKSMRSGVGMPYMQSSHSGILGCRPDGWRTCQALDLLPCKPIMS